MKNDPIVEEIREFRRKTEESFGRDWDRLFAHFLKVQQESKRPIYRGSPKRLAKPPRA